MKHWKIILVGLFIFHLILLVVSRFTAWPEMLFWPYLVLKGWFPYRDIGIAHSPLLVIVLTGFYKVMGIGIREQQVFSRGLALLTDLLIFLVLNRLFGRKITLLALLFYIPLQVYYDGSGVWFDHALTVFPILIYALLKKQHYVFSGLLWSLAFLTKQTAFWLLIPIFISFVIVKDKKAFFLGFTRGLLLVVSLFIFILFTTGLQNDYLDWTIRFGVGTLPGLAGKLDNPRLLIASLIPFTIFIPLFLRKEKDAPGLSNWSVAAAMGTLPRFELFHFQPALPFLAAAFALSLKKPTWLTFLIVLITAVLVGRGLVRNMFKQIRFYEDRDKEIVRVVDELTGDNEFIFVTNYWDNLYPLTGTLPVTRPFIPQLTQYLSQPGFEEENVTDINNTPPNIIVRGQFSGAGDPFRFEKINNFIDNHYQVIKTINGVDILQLK